MFSQQLKNIINGGNIAEKLSEELNLSKLQIMIIMVRHSFSKIQFLTHFSSDWNKLDFQMKKSSPHYKKFNSQLNCYFYSLTSFACIFVILWLALFEIHILILSSLYYYWNTFENKNERKHLFFPAFFTQDLSEL